MTDSRGSEQATQSAFGVDDLERLIARCAIGDRKAFEALYDATNAKLFAVCLRVLKQKPVAEEVMQDVYLKIWRNSGRYKVTGHSPMTWLITIARNTAVDRLRLQRGDEVLSNNDEFLVASGLTPEESAVAASEAKKLKKCLDTLSEARRAAIVGAYLDGLSYADLASRARVPLNTMRTWLRRSLIALRECMSK